MKLLYKLVVSISGCGLQLNRFTLQCLESISQKREICLLLKNLFIHSPVEKYGKHRVYTDGGTWYDDEACNILRLKHHLHSPLEKS